MPFLAEIKSLLTPFTVIFLVACGSSGSSKPDNSLDQGAVQAPVVQLPVVQTDDELVSAPGPDEFVDFGFEDVSNEFGLANYPHGIASGIIPEEAMKNAGGVAAGDVDKDGFIDLYILGGSAHRNYLLINDGGKDFIELGNLTGVAIAGEHSSGPAFVDIDGDADLDLFVGGVYGDPSYFFENDGGGFFSDVSASTGINLTVDNTFSASFGDYDRDGWLDMFLTHWGQRFDSLGADTQHLWRNNGNKTFTSVSIESGIAEEVLQDERAGKLVDRTLAGNFADINNDGYADLLVASDFGTSQVYLNNADGVSFTNVTNGTISDRYGMGTAIADVDNDGFLDWFVSAISLPEGSEKDPENYNGNRFYRNLGAGDGLFEDHTDVMGVREGFWGWAGCFADFNNDGYLDLFHVNGWSSQAFQEFADDPSRLYMGQADGTFVESSLALGINDRKKGRGVVCFDVENDGDIDIFIANSTQAPTLYRNNGGNLLNYLTVELQGMRPNTQAVGARVYATVGGKRYMRELQVGSSYVSQTPLYAHFGLAAFEEVEQLEVYWPDGEFTALAGVEVNQRLIIRHPSL